VKHLVNERSIAFDDDAKTSETIEYFCVKHDTHQVILAEGMAAETFRYWGGQIAWDNLADYQELYGRGHKVCADLPLQRQPRRGARLAPVGSFSFRRHARSDPDCLCPDRDPGKADSCLNGPTALLWIISGVEGLAAFLLHGPGSRLPGDMKTQFGLRVSVV
jgi:hypothetical protein